MSSIKGPKRHKFKANFIISVSKSEDGASYKCILSTEGRVLKPLGEKESITILKTTFGKTDKEAFEQMSEWVKKCYGIDIKWNDLNG